jgi:hypothetical protein
MAQSLWSGDWLNIEWSSGWGLVHPRKLTSQFRNGIIRKIVSSHDIVRVYLDVV